MTVSYQCISCVHFRGGRKCDAFPEEIPGVITTGEFIHDKEFPGDQGIRYEKTPDGETPLHRLKREIEARLNDERKSSEN